MQYFYFSIHKKYILKKINTLKIYLFMLSKETLEEPSYKKFLLDIIKEKCSAKKKCIYSDAYYLDNIILVLKDLVSWKAL